MDKADQLLAKLKKLYPQYFGNFKFEDETILDRLKSEADLKDKNEV